MGVDIEIAGIHVSIKGNKFLNSFSSVEKHLIEPFIINGRTPRSFENKSFSANIKFSTCLKESPVYAPLLLKKVMSCFPDNENVRATFKVFQRTLMPAYLNGNKIYACDFQDVFRDDPAEQNKIIISSSRAAIFNKQKKRIDVVVHDDKQHISPGYPDRLKTLMLLMRIILTSKNDGVILHASCLEDRKNGYVFMGPGNSGKSTAAQMLSPCRILSDDISVIRRIDNTYKIFPNPWWNANMFSGTTNYKYPVSLKALFFIGKAKKTSMRRLSYKEALGVMMYRDGKFHQMGFRDNKAGIRNFYLFSQGLLEQIPAFELRIKKWHKFKSEFNKLIDAHLK